MHEAGHILLAKISGLSLSGATIEPAPDGSFAGLVWGVNSATDQTEMDAYLRARCLELVGGTIAEQALLDGSPPLHASDDERQVQAYAEVFCHTPVAVAAFLSYCHAEARGLIELHRNIVLALADRRIVQRTLDAVEIDATIARAVAADELAAERKRRVAWQTCIKRATTFTARVADMPSSSITKCSLLE